ncbi:MAG: hypothetical protein ACRC0L_01580, partial [Angustibacter sp.]
MLKKKKNTLATDLRVSGTHLFTKRVISAVSGLLARALFLSDACLLGSDSVPGFANAGTGKKVGAAPCSLTFLQDVYLLGSVP